MLKRLRELSTSGFPERCVKESTSTCVHGHVCLSVCACCPASLQWRLNFSKIEVSVNKCGLYRSDAEGDLTSAALIRNWNRFFFLPLHWAWLAFFLNSDEQPAMGHSWHCVCISLMWSPAYRRTPELCSSLVHSLDLGPWILGERGRGGGCTLSPLRNTNVCFRKPVRAWLLVVWMCTHKPERKEREGKEWSGCMCWSLCALTASAEGVHVYPVGSLTEGWCAKRRSAMVSTPAGIWHMRNTKAEKRGKKIRRLMTRQSMSGICLFLYVHY